MEAATHGAYAMGPTLATRIWQRMGFFAHFDESLFDWRQDVPKGGDLITADTTIHLDWLDRIRLLISGKCSVTQYTKTAVEVGKTETRAQFAVLPP